MHWDDNSSGVNYENNSDAKHEAVMLQLMIMLVNILVMTEETSATSMEVI